MSTSFVNIRTKEYSLRVYFTINCCDRIENRGPSLSIINVEFSTDEKVTLNHASHGLLMTARKRTLVL